MIVSMSDRFHSPGSSPLYDLAAAVHSCPRCDQSYVFQIRRFFCAVWRDDEIVPGAVRKRRFSMAISARSSAATARTPTQQSP